MTPAFTIPRFKLPPLLAAIGGRLPQWPHGVALTAALNAAKQFGMLPADQLDVLEGRVFRVTVLDTGGVATFSYAGGAFRPVIWPDGEPDLAFAADLSAFLQLLARQEDPDTLFFNRQLSIEGDTELGLAVKNMLDAVEWPGLEAFLTRRRG